MPESLACMHVDLKGDRCVDFLVRQMLKEIVVVVRLVPQERVERNTDERFVDVSSQNYGQDYRKVQNCTTGAIFGKDQ